MLWLHLSSIMLHARKNIWSTAFSPSNALALRFKRWCQFHGSFYCELVQVCSCFVLYHGQSSNLCLHNFRKEIFDVSEMEENLDSKTLPEQPLSRGHHRIVDSQKSSNLKAKDLVVVTPSWSAACNPTVVGTYGHASSVIIPPHPFCLGTNVCVWLDFWSFGNWTCFYPNTEECFLRMAVGNLQVWSNRPVLADAAAGQGSSPKAARNHTKIQALRQLLVALQRFWADPKYQGFSYDIREFWMALCKSGGSQFRVSICYCFLSRQIWTLLNQKISLRVLRAHCFLMCSICFWCWFVRDQSPWTRCKLLTRVLPLQLGSA